MCGCVCIHACVCDEGGRILSECVQLVWFVLVVCVCAHVCVHVCV